MKRKLFLTLSLTMGLFVAVFAQRTVTGTVTNAADGSPVEGATVLAKGTTSGTFTGRDGSYSVVIPSEATILVFSFVGFKTEEVEIGNQSTINVEIAENLVLDEVVITGYGTVIKRELTGNIAKVSGEDIEAVPVASVEQALQGRSAGVFVESVNGKPGGAIRMRIRGASSITANNQPLYVVDGVPITVDPQNLSGAALNPLAGFNFNDVESIEILKDASAAAIYGSRAANGVVIITTKKGKQGKTNVDVNLQGGLTYPTGRRDFLNAEEFIQMFRKTAVGGARYDWENQIDGFGLGADYTEANNQQVYMDFVEGRFDRYSGDSDWRTNQTDTDWQDLAFREGDPAQFKQADVSFSGGNAKTKFFASASYSDQEGVLIGNGLERMSGRLNLSQEISDKLDFGMTMNLARTFSDQVSNDNAFSTPLQLIALSPITPPRNADGVLNDRPTTTYYNGLIDLDDVNRDVTTFRNLSNAFLAYELIPGLSIRGELGVDLYTLKDNSFFGRNTDGGEAGNGFGSSYWSQVLNLSTRAYATYNKTFDSHNLNVVAGTEFQKSTTDITRVEGQEFAVDDLKTLASAADITLGTSTLTQFSFVSYFGRLNYNFERKYLVSASIRADGSSRFGENNRYGVFPAASVGWVVSSEPFLANNSTLSFLKLRASYGLTGNAEIGNFTHLGLFGGEGYAGTPGLQPTQIPNPDLTWEKSTQLDIGIDYGLFNDRVTGEIDYYVKNTTDLLLDVPVPGTSGFRTQTRNLGEIENRGIEVVINSNNLVGEFQWTTSVNFAWNKNEVLSLGEQDIIDDGSSRYMNVVKVGEPIGAFFGREYAGVDPQTGDGLFYVNEMDADGNITSGDATTNNFNEANPVILGSPNPDFIGGMTNSFSYKGFDLSVMIQGIQGNSIHNGSGNFMSCGACWFDNQTRDQLDSWEQPGDITDVPEARFFWGNADQNRSSRYLEDGSYLRVKNITFGYTFPQGIMEQINMRSLRIYFMAQNVFTWTNYSGWDPEVTTDFLAYDANNRPNNIRAGIDFYAAPQPKTFTMGVKIGL